MYSALLTTALLQICLTSSIATAQRMVAADIWRPLSGTPPSDITTRQDPFGTRLSQKPDKSMYWINITLGTPGQPQALQLDTGSRQLWVPDKGSSLCSSALVDCAKLGSFDKAASSTFDGTDQSTTVGYSDGSSIAGSWFYDTVHVGDEIVTKQLAVLATTGSGVQEGVLGIGFPASYATLNHNLAAQGVIPSNKYSIWLDSLDATVGTILFGGVDLAKFVAPLKVVPVVGSGNQPTVAITRIATIKGGVTTVQTSDSYSENAVLDTGTTLTVLPKVLVSLIINAMGARYYPASATSGTTIIPCSQGSKSLSVNFHFGNDQGPTINVDISQLVLQNLGQLDGVDMCQFGIYASDGSYPTTLGDSFLRSAYVLYDLDNSNIGLAQSIVAPTTADLVEITANGD